MTLESAVSFFIAIFIFGITPGPGIFAILARALTQGSRACFMLALGMVASDILYLIAACLGLAAIATHWGELFSVIRIVGAIYLLYLGWKMWTAPVAPEGIGQDLTTSRHSLSFLQGFLISASNPKVILFYIAFLPTFMDLTVLGSTDILLASALTLVSLTLALMLIAGFAARARRVFTTEKAQKRLNRSAGSLMVGAGAFLLSRN